MTGHEISERTATNSNWFVDNVTHPFANAAVLEPWNAIASVANIIHHDSLPELSLLSAPGASGADWLAQSLSSGVGGLLPFVVAGKLTGSSMRGAGRLLESANLIECGGLAAKAFSSERLAMISGAGLYGAAEKPHDGQTRLGNAAAALVGMSAYELGGKLTEATPIFSLTGFGNRAMVGFAGGSTAAVTDNYISSWINTGHADVGSLNSITKAGVSGAAFNMFLPVVQQGVDSLKLGIGMSIPASHYATREGWGQNAELGKIVDQTPLTNVKRTDGAATINQTDNMVCLSADATAADLGHELAHRIRLKHDESKFQDAAAHLNPSQPELFNSDSAKQKFIDIRVRQEQAAREAQNRVAGNNDVSTDGQSILDSTAHVGVTYRQKFEQEADQFAQNTMFRPTEDNSETRDSTSRSKSDDPKGLIDRTIDSALSELRVMRVTTENFSKGPAGRALALLADAKPCPDLKTQYDLLIRCGAELEQVRGQSPHAAHAYETIDSLFKSRGKTIDSVLKSQRESQRQIDEQMAARTARYEAARQKNVDECSFRAQHASERINEAKIRESASDQWIAPGEHDLQYNSGDISHEIVRRDENGVWTRTQNFRDGTTIIDDMYGRRSTIRPDGTHVVESLDGYRSSYGTDGSETTEHPDGTLFEQSADYHCTQVNPDGTTSNWIDYESNPNLSETEYSYRYLQMNYPEGLGDDEYDQHDDDD